MIQISNPLSMNPETPAKPAGVGRSDSGFANLLAGELESDPAVGGKILPVALPGGGKILPVAASVDLPGESPVETQPAALPEGTGAKAPALGLVVVSSVRLATAAATAQGPKLADETEPKSEAPRAETNALELAKAVTAVRVRFDRAEASAAADQPADPDAVDLDDGEAGDAAERPAIIAEMPVDLTAALLVANSTMAPEQVEPMAANAPAPEEQASAENRADVARPEAKRAGGRVPNSAQSAMPEQTGEMVALKDGTHKGTEKESSAQGDGARGQRGNPELRFELSRASSETRFERAASIQNQIRMPLAAASQIVLPEQAVTGHVADVSALPSAANSASTSFASQQALRPHDFNALVDRLVEARETARGGSVDMAVMHAEFGEVSLRFRQDSSGLSVSMSNSDPEFARAVGAASQADGAQMGDNAGQGSRRDDNSQNSGAFSRSGTGGEWGQSSADANLNGGGRKHMQDGTRGEQVAAQPRAATGEDRLGRDEIYA